MLSVNITDAADSKCYNPEELAHQISVESDNVKRIGFIGLGAMGFGMATHLLKSNFCVTGYDVMLLLNLYILCLNSRDVDN